MWKDVIAILLITPILLWLVNNFRVRDKWGVSNKEEE